MGSELLIVASARRRVFERYRSPLRLIVAPVALRVMLASALIGQGSQKLFGWFGGVGLVGTADHFEPVCRGERHA